MAQVVENLPSKCKTLSSTPNTTKKKKKKPSMGEEQLREGMSQGSILAPLSHYSL
jgi:hypothetical protein